MSSPKELEESRRIELRELDGTHSIHPHIYFPTNEIKTSKYSIITFLPLNLFEQFHRLANIYFLILVILNWIPQLSVFGKEVSMFPLIFVLAATAVKDIYEDYTRYRSDNEINNRTCLEWKDRRLIEKRWKDVRVGDVIKVEMEKPIPADLVVLTTSNSDHNCFVSTMNLDGETNLKVRKSSSRHEFASFDAEGSIALDPAFDSIICELPHENIYKFLGFINRSVDGKMLDPIPLDAENILLRGSILRNTQWALGVVIYTGHETKAMLNSRRAPSKRSQLERQMNKMVLVLIILLLLICTACGVGTSLWEKNSPQELVEIILGPRLGSTLSGFLNFLSSIIVFQVMIPIAIYISVDVVNLFQVYFINRDQDLFHQETNQRMTCRALNIHSDLGQVHYIFSDKTGTLTCNRQTFHQCTVRGSRYSSPDIDDLPFPKLSKATRRLSNPNPDLGTPQDPFLHFFMLTLCICNTAMIDILHESDVDGIPSYQSESPDEVALVKAAARCGYVLQARSSDFIKVSIFGKEESFQILALFPFNSDRKRMSILVRSLETNQLLMLTKGADEMIFQRLAQNEADQPTILNIQSQLTEFSEKGLRTLCLAYRIWEENELENWTVQFNEASSALEQRETLLNKMFNESEQNFILLGATAVEDRLQEKVPETISTLYEAEISIWVLTGDMQNTAINVAYSCNLLNSKMDQFILSAEDSESCLALLNEFAGKMNDHSRTKALIIHGRSLLHLMTEQHEKTFFDFVSKCKIVICCRVSPLQKALVVNLVRKFTNKVTLAIGDGANDVGMIQAAHVGIGISGQEGRQAVMSSDFAIGEFRFLRDLLIVHGHWSYYRLAIFIFYFLYKNALFVMLLFWFQIYCAWSNQTPIDDLDLILYNMAYTLLPVIANAVFDMDIDRRVLLDNPWLYRIGQHNRLFKMRSFMLLMVDLLWQSVVITFLPIYLYWERGPYLFELGIPILTTSLIVVTLHLCLDTLHWTWVQHVIYWGTLIAYLPLNLIFDATPGSLNYRMLLEGLEDPLFYVTCLLTSVLAILPRFTAKASLGIFHPDLIAQARRFHSKKKKKKKIEKTDELTALKADTPKANYLETVNLV